ncbi:SRPBCC family protein [uncultured Pseudodesulfovibrio sp.]|uniref:SRPBCC family protein n=1 Tax=uncultured Pseudodesulfovibrio sp. TaxID=2035858 RepID=UPI0029C880B1|nr:SRPBCC family protein [uncultured Pseudodesulfovibrio sp.]
MAVFTPDRLTVSAEMFLEHPAEAIWPLLCPVREYDWIAHWRCEVLRSESGVNELGCVFRTNLPGAGPEVWLTSRFDPCERLEFVRTGRDRVIHFVIRLLPENGGTRLTWTHHVTTLTEAGNAELADKPAAFASQMAQLERMLGHYLETGGMLT